MPRYKYSALDANGRKLSGVMEGSSAVAVRNTLLAKQLDVHKVDQRKSWAQFEITTKKVKPADVMNFSRQLGAFLRAGVPILEALDALSEDMDNKQLKQILAEIQDALRSGSSFAAAVAEHSDVFPPYYVGILRSAELTGNLDVVLDQLAAYIERDLETRNAIRAALIYPVIVMALAVVTVIILVSYVLPKFETFFESFDAKLPFTTQLLLETSRFIGKWWWLIVAVIVGALVLGYLFSRTKRGRLTRDRMLLRIPVLRDVVRFAIVERFSRILGAMMRAGVPIPDAMSAASEATNNLVYQGALANTREEVMRGHGLAGPIAETQLFPGSATQMIRVGEQSGTLDRQLDIAADFYERELKLKLKHLTTLFEPVVIVIMGLVVGFVAIALVQAMYGIFNQVDIK
jgi:type IV pilus assembly protein PilC